MYVDESGVDSYSYRAYGWSLRGKKIYGEISGHRYARESFIAAKCGSRIFASFCFKGTCKTELFNVWLKEYLVPILRTGQTVVMDNATFHKSRKTKELIEEAGCFLLFLPTYSPDLNPIEKTWANLKRMIANTISDFKNLSDAINHAFMY